MKMANPTSNADDLRPEYEESLFANAVRGKYAAAYRKGTNLVRIASDVAAEFPNEQAVNDALRFVLKIIKMPIGLRSINGSQCQTNVMTSFDKIPSLGGVER